MIVSLKQCHHYPTTNKKVLADGHYIVSVLVFFIYNYKQIESNFSYTLKFNTTIEAWIDFCHLQSMVHTALSQLSML